MTESHRSQTARGQRRPVAKKQHLGTNRGSKPEHKTNAKLSTLVKIQLCFAHEYTQNLKADKVKRITKYCFKC